MSKNQVVCDKCGKETDTYAIVDGVTFCAACVPIEFIKARRVERKQVDNGRKLQVIEKRLTKAVENLAREQAKVDRYTAAAEKAERQAAIYAERIEKFEAQKAEIEGQPTTA